VRERERCLQQRCVKKRGNDICKSGVCLEVCVCVVCVLCVCCVRENDVCNSDVCERENNLYKSGVCLEVCVCIRERTMFVRVISEREREQCL